MGPARPAVRILAVSMIIALSTVLGGSAAFAGSKGQSRSTGEYASTQWTEWGELGGTILGNVHVGDLFVDGSTQEPSVWGNVFDWTCPDGVRPPHGGHAAEGDPPAENGCVLESVRFLYAEPGAVSFSMDRRFDLATLTGTLSVSDHGGGATAQPPVNLTWTGVGSKTTEKMTQSYDDGSYSHSFRYTGTRRSADVDGHIGGMGFTDDADDESTSVLGSYREMHRWSSN